MEFYCVMRVNEEETGALLEKVDLFTECAECSTVDEFGANHGDDVREYLENKLKYDYKGSGALVRMDIVALADDFDEETNEDNGEDCE